MRKIGCDAGGVDHIVQDELVNQGGELEEQREGLESVYDSACEPSRYLRTWSRSIEAEGIWDAEPGQCHPKRRQQLEVAKVIASELDRFPFSYISSIVYLFLGCVPALTIFAEVEWIRIGRRGGGAGASSAAFASPSCFLVSLIRIAGDAVNSYRQCVEGRTFKLSNGKKELVLLLPAIRSGKTAVRG